MQEPDLIKQLLSLAHTGCINYFREIAATGNLGAKPNFWNKCYHSKSGDTLLHVACRCGNIALVRFLREELEGINFEQANHDGKRPLHEAAQSGQTECLGYLISIGVELDCLKKADWTPLMLSSAKDNLEVVQKLVRAGASLGLKNKDGWTAFHIACRQGNPAIVSFLLDSDSSIWKTVSKNGRTPLHTAALNGKADVVRLLLTRANYASDQMDSCGTTPLMDALRAGHPEIADVLISSHRANVEAWDKLGRQALHLAAQAGSCESVAYLIDTWSVDCNGQTHDGETPLHFACKERHGAVADMLLAHFADPNLQDGKGRTACQLVEGWYDSPKIVEGST